MKNCLTFCFASLIILAALGCNNSDDDSIETREDVSCTLNLGVNLASISTVVDSSVFSPTDQSSYTSSASNTFFDIFGNSYDISLYFLKTNEKESLWDVFFYLEGVPINILSGVIGNGGQTGAQLQFDAAGQLILVEPLIISSENLVLRDDIYTHSINIIFSDFFTTQLDAAFTVAAFGNSCFLNG